MSENQHKAWLDFVRKAMELPIEYSIGNLEKFRRISQDQYPALVKVIESYISLIRQSSINEVSSSKKSASSSKTLSTNSDHVPLLDLLRDTRIFATNRDIASFAQKIVPNMRNYRFDKMAKSDVALRIIQYLETLNPKTRQMLEASMRESLNAPQTQAGQKKGFVSK